MAVDNFWSKPLRELPPIVYESGSEPVAERLDRLSLGTSLPLLAKLDHEQEYELCRSLTAHLLGAAPEPEDVELPPELGSMS